MTCGGAEAAVAATYEPAMSSWGWCCTGARPRNITAGNLIMDIVGIILQLIAGAVGGNAAGRVSPKLDIGSAGNSIAGAIGGVVVGQILERLTGGAVTADQAAAAASNFDIAGIITSLIGGGAGGAILTGIIGAIKNR